MTIIRFATTGFAAKRSPLFRLVLPECEESPKTGCDADDFANDETCDRVKCGISFEVIVMRLSSSPEIAILSRVVRPETGDLKPSAAKELLKLRFAKSDRAYMRKLLAKNNA